MALNALARALGIPGRNTYAIEVSESRSEDLRREYPETRILGPASFAATGVSYNAFSLLYVNPPYADELGGGRREELSFLIKAVYHGAPGAAVVLVIPEATVFDWGKGPDAMRRTLVSRLEGVRVLRLPDEHRKFREVVVLGRKRRQATAEVDHDFERHWYDARDRMGVLGEGDVAPLKLPPGKEPRRWGQTGDAPGVLRRKVAASPLGALLAPPRPSQAAAPPRAPGKGHTALILASGDLDGLVWPPGEPPHVVRGTSRKTSYRDEAKCETTENEDGSVTTKEVYSERIALVVRAVGVDGRIHTFTGNNEPSNDRPPPATDEG